MGSQGETVREMLGRCLVAAGVEQVWGRAVPGLAHRAVDDGLASMLASADGRLGPGPGAALLDGQVLVLTARPGEEPEPMPVVSPELLPEIVARGADWSSNDSPGASAFRLDLDLDAPTPAGAAPVVPPPRPAVDLDAARRPLLFVGPGVVRRGHVEDLRRLATVSGLGVSNTWGAKGVFPWDSPHHLGTVGLQARDYELGGFAEADVVIAVGLDPDESPPDAWMLGADVIAVPPHQLGDLTDRWRRPPAEPVPPPLMMALGGVCMPAYGRTEVPFHPCRVIAETKAVMSPGDRVAAEPGGIVGAWVGRAFPTSELGSVVVPATVVRGFAVAAAIAAAARDEPQRVIAVMDQADELPGALLDAADRLGVDVITVAWGPDGEPGSVEALAEIVRRGVESISNRPPGDRNRPPEGRIGGVRRVDVPVAVDRFADLEAVAGPVAAWSQR